MLRRLTALLFPAALSITAATLSSPALAGPLRITVQDNDGHSVVRIVDSDGSIATPSIATSRRGYMFTFAGETIEPTRIESDNRRLEYVQAAQYGDRAVVRLSQSPNLRGGIKSATTMTTSADTLQLVVFERNAPPSKPDPAPAPAEDVASLAAKLGPAPEVGMAKATEAAADDGAELELDDEDTAAHNADANAKPVDARAAEPADKSSDQAENADTWPLPAAATESSPLAPVTAGPERSTLWTVAGTATIAIACVPLLLWLRRRNSLPWATQQRLEVLAKTSLGPKQHVVCIRVDGRELLIGVTEHQVRLIADLSTSVAPAHGHATASAHASPPDPTAEAMVDPASPQAPRIAAAAERLDAFKSKLAGALAHQGQHPPPTSWSDQSSGVIELERILAKRPDAAKRDGDPNWATNREVV